MTEVLLNSLPDPSPKERNRDRYSRTNRRRLSAPGIRTFGAIADRWGLPDEQRRVLLGNPARAAYRSWCKRARYYEDFALSVRTLLRISAILGVHQGLGVLFADEKAEAVWLRDPHQTPVFGGVSPLALMLTSGESGILAVRRYLEVAGTGLHMPPTSDEIGYEPYTDEEIIVC
ncbi:MbcA/ParS/Xre antitoxin family protein [Novosphingobium sp. BL-8A]|uniref:antitoxin Xre/MbcA/ParS toxin-binding domain-containing protein n=1 Tax=Novosphingobium sp. BL-8A TaxID=3127639 RepID=UPI00375698F7